jgi:type IV pilus assembly protein PilE
MKQYRGFTLIELMIVVAIIGIIGAIAYPSYVEYVNKSRRADGMAALQSFAGAMERHFTVQSTYAGAATGTLPSPSSVFATRSPVDSSSDADAFYLLRITSLGATSFELSAIPANAQSGDRCGTLTLEHTGARGAAQTDCWP